MTMKNKPRVIGVIPARWASTRLPGKPLVSIAGKPMIVRVAERAAQARRLAAVRVAVDDERVANAVEQAAIPGVQAVMTRPDHLSGTDRVAEAAAGDPCDAVVNIQGDEPLIDPALIDRLAEVIISGDWDMATAAAPLAGEADLHSPSVVKAVFNRDGQALYFSRAPVPCNRDGEPSDGLFWRHIGIYAYTAGFLQTLTATPSCGMERLEKLEQLRALHIGCRMKVLKVEAVGMGVDTPEDIEQVEAILRRGPSH